MIKWSINQEDIIIISIVQYYEIQIYNIKQTLKDLEGELDDDKNSK